jgi:hypothetical protein
MSLKTTDSLSIVAIVWLFMASVSFAQAQTLTSGTSPSPDSQDHNVPFWDTESLTVISEEGISLEITRNLFQSQIDIQTTSELPDFGYFAYSIRSLDGQYLRLVEGEITPLSEQIQFSSTTLMRAPEELSGDGSESFTDGDRTFYAVASASGATDEWYWWELTEAGLAGLGQGAVNIANGLQDTVIGVANIPAAAVNGIAWTEEQLRILDGDDPIRVPYIPSPDWSKDLVVEEDDFSHGVSKFAGAGGVEILSGVWIAKLVKAGKIERLLRAGQQVDRNGLTKAGRALQKHGDRTGSVFPKSSGSSASRNAQGQRILEDILKSKSRRTKPNRFGGQDIIDDATGRGARFDSNGDFIGFIKF